MLAGDSEIFDGDARLGIGDPKPADARVGDGFVLDATLAAAGEFTLVAGRG